MADTQTKVRSPSYPSISLRDAVASIANIESRYRAAAVDRVEAAKLIGYSALSGPASKALADLAAYGLLERAGKGDARVTELARDILHTSNDQERRERLKIAAFTPALFREIRDRFVGVAAPDDGGVVAYLNRRGFNANAVRPAAKAFLQTMSYLKELGALEGASDSDGVAPPPAENAPLSGRAENEEVKPPPPPTPSTGRVQAMEGERVVFTEEGQPNQYLKLIAAGDIDEGLLDALTDYVKRQRKRLGLTPLPPPAFGKPAPSLLSGNPPEKAG